MWYPYLDVQYTNNTTAEQELAFKRFNMVGSISRQVYARLRVFVGAYNPKWFTNNWTFV